MTPRDFVRCALKHVGAPYIWAARGPLKWTPNGLKAHGLGVDAYDCSGLVLCALREAGGPDLRATHNADLLYRTLTATPSRNMVGALLFYGSPSRATHVAISLGNDLVLEAGGGGPATLLVADAKKADAKVRVCFDGRTDFLGARLLPESPGVHA